MNPLAKSSLRASDRAIFFAAAPLLFAATLLLTWLAPLTMTEKLAVTFLLLGVGAYSVLSFLIRTHLHWMGVLRYTTPLVTVTAITAGIISVHKHIEIGFILYFPVIIFSSIRSGRTIGFVTAGLAALGYALSLGVNPPPLNPFLNWLFVAVVLFVLAILSGALVDEERQLRKHSQDLRRREQSALFELADSLIKGNQDLSSTAHAALKIAANVLDADAAAILIKDGEQILVQANWGDSFAKGTELAQQAITWGKAMVYGNRTMEEYDSESPEEKHHSAVAVPILREGAPSGAMLIHTFAPRFISEDDVHLLALIASQTTVAVERKLAEEALDEVQERFRTLVDSANDPVIIADGKGKIISWNVSAERVFMYAPDEIIGQPLTTLMPARYHDQHLQALRFVRAGGESHVVGKSMELVGLRKDGTEFPLELSLSTFNSKAGRFYSGILRDISERKQAETVLEHANQELKQSVAALEQQKRDSMLLNEMANMLQTCHSVEEAYAVIVQFIQEIFPAQSGVLYLMNASRNLMEGVAEWGDAKLDAKNKVLTPDDCWALRLGRVYETGTWQDALRCRHIQPAESDPTRRGHWCLPLIAQGETLGMLNLQISPDAAPTLRLADHRLQLAVTTADHIALALANLRLRETLRRQSVRDPLTDLYNRRYMEETFDREMQRAARNHQSVGVIMLDLDNFKNFNDTFGHGAGDVLLREIAALLKSRIRTADIACRYGGEEFVLVLSDASLEQTRLRAEHIREQAKHVVAHYRGQSLGGVTLSLGVAVYPTLGTTVEDLVRAADIALYRAKNLGKDRVVVAESEKQEARS